METKMEFYTGQLYPFQNEIIKIANSLQNQFYLTGGTCLSRAYLNHRYSDDLDFFVNDNNDFERLYEKVSKAIAEKYDAVEITSAKTYKNLKVHDKNGTMLIIDFVNDLPSHFGDIRSDKILGRIDSIRNILSNKISAIIGRSKAKDIIDLWAICRNFSFDFSEIIKETETKEANVEIPYIIQTLKTLPQDYINKINWIKKPDYDEFRNDIGIICDDMINQRANFLYAIHSRSINQESEIKPDEKRIKRKIKF